jgi:protein O-GlcNAc transferase
MSAGRDTAIRELERGNQLCLSGEVAAGVEKYRCAIAADPEFAPAHVMLGAALQALGRVGEAREPFERGAALDPGQANAHFGLGNVYLQLGRLDDAAAAYHRALELQPNFPDALLNLGVTYGRKRHFDLAAEVLGLAVQIKPDYPEAQGNLGAALRNLGQFDAAEAALRKGLPERAGVVDVRANLGLLMFDQGRIEEAIAVYEEAITLNPAHMAVWRNRIAAVLYDPARDESRHWELLQRFEARFTRGIANPASFANLRDPDRRLRIGYVSSDLVDNPIARNLKPVLEHRDRERFEVIAYAEVARADGMTNQLRALTDEWRWTIGLSDADLAAQITQDRIDVLVLLATRLDKGRPMLAVHRAAPVQVSFHDPGTSGLAAMEYLIGDRILVPRRPVERFRERVIRLPSFYIHAPIEQAPAVSALPAVNRGYVTFGSFNNPAKVNDRVLALWGEVLRAVPESRLKLKFKNWFANLNVRDRVLHGLDVEPERIEFGLTDTMQNDHMALYADVDIALDPFPFTGSTTTFEALWMGVPVVTLRGEAMVGRWSASMLHALKLDELIADSPARYIEIASTLAQDKAKLGALRAGLRERLRRSPLTDGRQRARQMERVYRALWRRWCRRQ